MAASVKVVAILSARPGKIEELKTLLASMVSSSRAESGNLAAPHYKNYLSRINDLAERTAVVLDPIEVT